MRKDSILQNYYFQKLPKAKKGGAIDRGEAPNLNKIIKENLDKTGHIPNKTTSGLPKDKLLNQYKKGGGMFPEYHSYTAPRMKKGGTDCPDGYFYSEEDDDCIPMDENNNFEGGIPQNMNQSNQRFNTGFGLSGNNYNLNYGMSMNPITKQDISHNASIGLPNLINVGANKVSLNASGNYDVGKGARGNASIGIPISKNASNQDRITLTGGYGKNFMSDQPASQQYGVSYAGKMFGQKGPTVTLNANYSKQEYGGDPSIPNLHEGWLNRYSKGGTKGTGSSTAYGTGTPFEIYDRIYLDKTGKLMKQKYGGNNWLNQYATGGPGDEQDWGTAGNAAWTAAQIADPTGILSYGDAYRGWRDMVKNPSWGNFGMALLNTAAALPVVGEGARIAKLGTKAGKISKEWKELNALQKVGRVANKAIIHPIATIDKGVGAGHVVGAMTAKAIEKSPKVVKKFVAPMATTINRGVRWDKLMEPVGDATVNGIGWGLNKLQDATQKYGGQPCYNCGGMYKVGGVTDDKKKGKKQKAKDDYVDLKQMYNLDPFSKEGIAKAQELTKTNPNTRIVCTAAGCSEIAVNAANAFGYDFNRGNAWDLGNKNKVISTNPTYKGLIGQGILPDPKSYIASESVYNHPGAIIGLNRRNNDVGGRATSKKDANDSLDYANQELYPGSRGYEHVGYMIDGNTMLHGTGANAEHPAYYVIDPNVANGVQLTGYGSYQPVEAITPDDSGWGDSFKQGYKNVKSWFGFEYGGMSPDIHEGWLDQYAGGGLIDYLSSNKKSSDFESRKKIANANGIKNYTGTAEQNTKLLELLSSGKKAVANTNKGVPVITEAQRQANLNPFVTYPSTNVNSASSIPYFPKVNGAQPTATIIPAKKTTSAKAAPKVVSKEEGLAAIHAFNQNNPDAIPYQNTQQAQLNPKKTKHTFQDLKTSIQSIPQNETFGLPMNVSNYLKNHFSPNANMSLTSKDLSDEQKLILWQTIQASQQRNKGALSGGADYGDYPTDIGRSARGFMDNPSNLPEYLSTPEGQLSTTLGGFTYNQDPVTGEYIVTDKYNFSNARDASRKDKKGVGIMGKLRKKADEDEAKNLSGESDSYWGAGANRRVGISITPAEIERIKNKNKKLTESNLLASNKYVNNASFFKKYGGSNWLNKYIN